MVKNSNFILTTAYHIWVRYFDLNTVFTPLYRPITTLSIQKTYFFKLIHDSGRFVRALLSNDTFRRLNKNPKLSGSLAIPLSPRSSSTKSTNSPNLSKHKIIYCYNSGLSDGPHVRRTDRPKVVV